VSFRFVDLLSFFFFFFFFCYFFFFFFCYFFVFRFFLPSFYAPLFAPVPRLLLPLLSLSFAPLRRGTKSGATHSHYERNEKKRKQKKTKGATCTS